MEREVTIKLQPHQHAVIMDDSFISAYRLWSEPLQAMIEPGRDGSHDVLDMTLRQYECPRCRLFDH